MSENNKNKNWVFTPVLGILLFVLLYIIATWYYPGGSNLDRTSKGFDWLKNYWCDLTGQIAKNGENNFARPIALTAMIILCSSLSLFWFYLPRLFQDFSYNKTIRYFGIGSMTITLFLFTDFHDTVINISGALGLIVLTVTFKGLYQYNFLTLFCYGLFCLALLFFNYIIYETNQLYSFQPILQKVNFVLFLSWICAMDIQLYQKTKFE